MIKEMNIFSRALRFIRSQFSYTELQFLVLLLVLLFIDRSIVYDSLWDTNLNGWIGYFLYGIFPWLAFVSVPLLLFAKYSRFLYYPLVCLFVLLLPLLLFVRVNFEMQLDGDWVGIVMGSSPEELKWFFGQYFGGLFIVSLAGTLVAILLAILAVNRLKRAKWTITKASLSIPALVWFCTQTAVLQSPRKTLLETLPSVNLVYDSFASWSGYRKLIGLKTNPVLPEDVCADENLDSSCLGVFVLGESATRNHWSLYGYERSTTPCLDAIRDELSVFDNVVTPVSGTARAMELMFTVATVENPDDFRCTLPQIFSCAGIDSFLYSSQARWGRFDGSETFAFSGCKSIVFMNEQGLGKQSEWFDDVLLDYLERHMEKDRNPQIVFLHLRGSHAPASIQYPPGKAVFEPEKFAHSADSLKPGKTRNHYDNSICFTDNILGQIVDRLKRRGGAAWMIYISDHGETPNSPGWRTASDRDLWEVPMVVWLSDEYKLMFPGTDAALKAAVHKPLQSDQLLAGFLHVAGVRGGGVNTWADFLNQNFTPRAPRKIEGGKCDYKWER